MLPIFTAEEMAALDKAIIEDLGIPGAVLMESAARGVFRTAIEILSSHYGAAVPLPFSACHSEDECGHGPDLPAHMIARGRTVKIFCGKGNNGGDGLAVARMLDSVDAEVEVVLMCKGEELTGDARLQYELCNALDVEIHEDAVPEDFFTGGNYHLVIDALLGTGTIGAARGKIAEAIGEINNSTCPVISIDIPSGVEGSSGKALGPAVYASATPTMAGLKRGLVFSPGREMTGEVSIVDIGSPAKIVEESAPYFWRIEPDDVIYRLPVRAQDTHKGECGRVFILAGSIGMTGAAVMTAEACVRSGAGLVVLGIPASLNSIAEAKLTEAMTVPLEMIQNGGFSPLAEKEIRSRLNWATACAIGPGISRVKEICESVRNIIKNIAIPAVIDADALYALAEKPECLKNLPEKCILTPHLGEFARMLEMETEAVKENRVELALEKAADWNAVIVLKGSPTLIACQDGNIYCNPSGNPGMATGGVGDVLTGHLAALLGMGMPPDDAAIAGVYLHGLAGDFAAAEKGEFGMKAGDIIDKLPEVLKEFGC